MIELAVFDWNGTILADTQALMNAGNLVIQTYGGTPLSRRDYSKKFYFPAIDFFCEQGCDREALERSAAYLDLLHSVYESQAVKCRTRKGARKVLQCLKENSVDSVILSNHMKEAIETQLKRLGLESYFSEILANTDYSATQKGNNKINRLRYYLERRGQDPAKACIVGDAPEDIEIGKRFNMRTVAITDGYYSTDRLRASNPDARISRLDRLIEIFTSV